MTSQDNQQYITVELFDSKMATLITQIQLGNEKLRNELNSKIDAVKSELHDVKSELHSEIQAVDANVQVNSAKIEMLGYYMSWGFAIMTLIITLIAIFVPYFFISRKDNQDKDKAADFAIYEDKIQQMIDKTLHNMSIQSVGK